VLAGWRLAGNRSLPARYEPAVSGGLTALKRRAVLSVVWQGAGLAHRLEQHTAITGNAVWGTEILSRIVQFSQPAPTVGHRADVPDEAEASRFALDVERLSSNVLTTVVAAKQTALLALCGLFAEGHVLLEDLPGVGKTLLAKTLARSIEGSFKRVQFTPDLLPSDITGTTIFDMPSGKFQFVAGPVFCNILLADEINRTGPRTQSALLEAMAESQVTVDGNVQDLARPFMVIATQNLSESHGTFPLPDSQKDRFMISMGIGMPSAEQEAEILQRSRHGTPTTRSVMTTARVLEMQDLVKRNEVSHPVVEYMVNVLRATRTHPEVEYGASPRGGSALQRASQCWALFSARPFVTPEDVQKMAPYVLAHRLGMRPGVDVTAEVAVAQVLESVPVPA